MKGPPVLNEKTAQKEKVLGEWPDTFYLDKALRKSRGKKRQNHASESAVVYLRRAETA